MKLVKRKPTWTCGYYEVTVRGKPVKRVMLILQDPRYPRKCNDMNHCQEQGVYGVRGLSDLSVELWVEEALSKKHEADSYSVYD